MHITENMFISNILLCQDPLSGGDQLQDLPLAPYLPIGVEIDSLSLLSTPPCPISITFVFLCWQDEDRLPTNISTWQFAGSTLTRLFLEWEKQSLLEIGWNMTNLENCYLFVWIFLPLSDEQHQDLPLAPLQVCFLEDFEVCGSSMMPS